MNNHRKAFTLIELLITMAIFSIIAVVSYNSLSASFKNEVAHNKHSEQLFQLQKTLNFLERDITQSYNQNISLNDSGLTLTTLQNDELLSVNYAINSAQLFRQDVTDISNPKTLLLLENIKKASIAVLDESNQWKQKWRKNSTNKAKAIQIKLNHPNWGEVTKLVVVDD